VPELLDVLREGNPAHLWRRCCGFIDLDTDSFMTIQRQLFAEQVILLNQCDLGRKLLHGLSPKSIEELREKVPLTLYSDYVPYLSEKIEDALPEKPIRWMRTSGRSSEYAVKWVPLSGRTFRELGDLFMAALIFASCGERGKVSLTEGDKFLYALAPPPYASGSLAHRMDKEDILQFLPPLDVAEKMEFSKRIEEGFKLGMSQGIDLLAAVATILVAVGDKFGQGGINRLPALIRKPKLLARMTGALVKSGMAGRRLMPKDIWKIKGLISTGTDSYVFREKIKEMWGRYPLDIYGSTESAILAMQTWDYNAMTFVPNLNLWEFIPESEHALWAQDRSCKPKTFFFNEVVPGERYVVVLTSFLGGPFVRYVMGDVVTVTALRNDKLNINLPQITFYGRSDDIMDFEGYTHAFITEKMLWEAIARTGYEYVDWVARKEVIEDTPRLHIYIEPKGAKKISAEKFTEGVQKELEVLNPVYGDLEHYFGYKPLKITLLASGSFSHYMANRRANGADLAHIKPPHMNPRDPVMKILLGPNVSIPSKEIPKPISAENNPHGTKSAPVEESLTGQKSSKS
jgi:hypothetical protein